MIQQRKKTDYILPILTIILSLGGLTSTYDFSNIFSLLVSLTGIAAGIMFFTNNKLFFVFLQIWIYAQFPSITRTVYTSLDGMQVVNEFPIIDGGQVIKQGFGLSLDTIVGDIQIYINIVPFIFVILYKILLVSSLIGKPVKISKFRQDNKLGEVFPLIGKIIKRVEVESEKYWVLAELDNEFDYDNISFKYLLLKAKDDQIYKAGKKKYVSYIRLVNNPSNIGDKVDNKEKYPFVDWGIVEINK